MHRYCDNAPSCFHVKNVARNAVIQCYRNLTTNWSICDLPCAEYVRVFWTEKGYFINRINDTAARFRALEKISCLSRGVSQCSVIRRPKQVTCRGAFRAAAYLKHYRLSVKITEPFNRSTACPFARTSTVTDNELAFAITDSISSRFRWYENSTVDWYCISKSYSVQISKIYIEVLTNRPCFQSKVKYTSICIAHAR